MAARHEWSTAHWEVLRLVGGLRAGSLSALSMDFTTFGLVMTWDGLLHRLTRRNVVLGLYVALALAASGQQLWSAATSTRKEPPLHRYNNYVIFERSWDHLVSGQDLYAWHPEEHWDLFIYTPTFAVLMAPFSALPDAIGLPLWNLLNALVLVLAVFRLPMLREHQQGLALVICAVECMTSLQNAQSNGLVVGLLVLAFAELERGKAWLPALCVLAQCIHQVVRHRGACHVCDASPALEACGMDGGVGIDLGCVASDCGFCGSLCLARRALWPNVVPRPQRIPGLQPSRHPALLVWPRCPKALVCPGQRLFMLPVLHWRKWADPTHRLRVLCLILWWVLVFNHKSESPTFIIAMAGVGLWFVHAPRTRLNLGLMWFALILTSLVTTDLCPRWVREQFVNPYALKALPIVALWVVVMWRSMRPPPATTQTSL